MNYIDNSQDKFVLSFEKSPPKKHKITSRNVDISVFIPIFKFSGQNFIYLLLLFFRKKKYKKR